MNSDNNTVKRTNTTSSYQTYFDKNSRGIQLSCGLFKSPQTVKQFPFDGLVKPKVNKIKLQKLKQSEINLWKKMFSLKAKTIYFILHLLLAYLCLRSAADSNDAKINIREKEKQFLDQMLTNGKYDARIRPSGINETDGPVVVRVSLYVRSMSTIDDAKMEYSLQLTLREQWVDERLKFDNIGGTLKYLTLTETNRIWMPDLFFRNEKESHFHSALMPNVLFHVFPNGAIQYSTRVSLTLSCPMNFKRYPFDRQYCPLRISSYGSTTDDVVVLWKEYDAVQVSTSSKLGGFTLEDHSPDYCTQKSIAPEYSCLKVNFAFDRALLYYVIRIYIPCLILVLASFVSFWLDQEAVTARVFLGALTLVTMVVEITNITASMPVISYVKAIDIWTGVCLMFIFGTLLEFATLNYISKNGMKRKCEQANVDEISSLNQNNATKESMKTWTSHCTWFSKCSISKKIDITSRIVFPLTFALFNLAYWWIYLTPEKY